MDPESPHSEPEHRLEPMSSWRLEGYQLVGRLRSPTRREALSTLVRASRAVAEASHEPDVDLRLTGRQLVVTIPVVPDRGLSDPDLALARRIDRSRPARPVFSPFGTADRPDRTDVLGTPDGPPAGSPLPPEA